MHETLAGEASLHTLEPNLRVHLVVSDTGQITVDTSITPDHLHQRHDFQQEIDQTYLPEVIRGLARVLQRFPVRGEPLRSS
jgi:hypothetical protein